EFMYQRIRAGMMAIEKPMPVPGNWKNARAASNRAKPAMISTKSRAHGWSDQRLSAARIQMTPLITASQPHSPTCSTAGRSPNSPNQSKPMARRPKKKNSNPASSPKKPMTETRIGGFRTRRVPPLFRTIDWRRSPADVTPIDQRSDWSTRPHRRRGYHAEPSDFARGGGSTLGRHALAVVFVVPADPQ